MKIEKNSLPVNENRRPQNQQPHRPFWTRWYVQAVVIFLAFLAGALVYRSGVVRPLTLQVRSVLTSGLRSADLPPFAEEAVENVTKELRMYMSNGLPTLYIDIAFEDYQKLLEKRNQAIDLGILIAADDDEVPAVIQFADGPKLDVDMRLKGDWTDHLQGDKWSFRIDLKEDGQVFGAEEFSIQTPETREFLLEWLFHQNLMEEGVLTTRYDFMNVLLNGELLGVYAFEDAFTGEMIESQGRRQGVIIRFSEDLVWENRAQLWREDVISDGVLTTTGLASAPIDSFNSKKIAENPVLAAEARTAQDLLYAYQTGQRPASEVFDLELMGRFFALSDLWEACHGVIWHNIRFYYNPVTTLLEPVGYDNAPFHGCNQESSLVNQFIETSLFDDPEIRAAYTEAVARYASQAYVDGIRSRYGEQIDYYIQALKIEYPADLLAIPWERLSKRAAAIQTEIQPVTPVRGSYQLVASGGRTTLVTDLINLMLLPVEVLGLEVDGVRITAADLPVSLPMVQDPAEWVYQPMRVNFLLERDWDPEVLSEVSAVVRVKGLTQEILVPLSNGQLPDAQTSGPLPETPTLQTALERYPFLTNPKNDSSILAFEPGNWKISGDLVLPFGVDLYVPAGTVLQFEPGAVILAHGAVQLMGTEDVPVILTAQDPQQGWGGIVVLDAERPSTWSYAAVEHTAGISREGWILTGGITFYQSEIRLDHAVLGNNMTEDAINVIHGVFKFHNSEFTNTFADAFDSDFSQGEIVNCYFHDIEGDAVDVSGTVALVQDTRLERIVDKGVSVGEDSQITVVNTVMDTVGIGVASKDLSTARLEKTTIRNASFAALAAYIKKPVYGPALIEAPDVIIEDTQTPAIAQTGSTILLWGETVATVEMDVDRLYQEKILGN